MLINLYQNDIVACDPEANRKAFGEMLMGSNTADVHVLPEMWTTGFEMNPVGIAESGGESLRWMQQMARKLNAAVAGTIAVECEGRYYNRFYFVTPEDTVYYDKHHLFAYSGEDINYTPGHDRVVVEWRGVRFLLQVCYDLRFPVFSRNTAGGAAQYDVVLYPASWPASRRSVWDVLLRARAIENQCYAVGVNRIGTDGVSEYNGGTCAIDAYGRVAAQCPDGVKGVATVDVDMAKLQSFRKKFPVLDDADHNIV